MHMIEYFRYEPFDIYGKNQSLNKFRELFKEHNYRTMTTFALPNLSKYHKPNAIIKYTEGAFIVREDA